MARFSTETQTTADLEANANLAKALSGLVSANRALINTAVSEQARTFRTLQKVIGDFNNANNTGSASGYMRAAVDLATAQLQNEPVNQQLPGEVSKYLDDHPGMLPYDPVAAKAIWQNAARMHFSESAQAWGNVDYLRKQTGMEGKSDEQLLAVVTDNSTDPRATANIRAMLDQARRQQQVIDLSKSLQAQLKPGVDVLLTKYGSVENIPQAELEKWKQEHQPELLRARTAFGMADIKKLADAEANKEVVLTGTAKEEYDRNVALEERLLAQTTTESDRDRAAAIINSPKFQEYARSNGFTIGTVTAPDPNKQYEKAELTTSGLYSPGRDDYKAIMLFQRQLSQDPNKWHPFMPQGAGTRGNLQEYGSINVQLAPPGATPAPAAAPEPPPAEEFKVKDWTYRLYNGEVLVVGGPEGVETAATPESPLKLPPETAKKAMMEYAVANGMSATDAAAEVESSLAASKAAAPSEAAPGKAPETETVYGAFNKKFGADPIGSQRVSGKLYLKDASTGNFYLAPDQPARAEGTTLTAGGGPNALKAFAEEVRARREANIARRGLSKEDGAKAPLRAAAIGLAQDLTPTQQTPAEKARAVEYATQQEMERRALEQAATEAPTSQREAVLRAQQAWNTANAPQGILGREFDTGPNANAPITSVPQAPVEPPPAPPTPPATTPVGIERRSGAGLLLDPGATPVDRREPAVLDLPELPNEKGSSAGRGPVLVSPVEREPRKPAPSQRVQILNPADYISMGPETGRNRYVDRKKVEFDPNKVVSPRESGSMRAPTYTAPAAPAAPAASPKVEKNKPEDKDARAAPIASTLTPDQRARQERVVKDFYKMPPADQRGALLKVQSRFSQGPTYGQTPTYRDSQFVPTASSLE